MRLAFVPVIFMCLVQTLAGTAWAVQSESDPTALEATADYTLPAPEAFLSDGFVKAEGTHFSLNGQPFYFQGSNFYRLGLIDRQADNEVYDIMRQYQEKGIKVVRIWGFSCGEFIAKSMIKTATKGDVVYDQDALRRLDIAIDAARVSGIKIILPLVNYQAEYCPMSWWVKQVKEFDEGKVVKPVKSFKSATLVKGAKPVKTLEHVSSVQTGKLLDVVKTDPQLFYTDPEVRAAFKRHIKTLLTRENVIYQEKLGKHLSYRDDPTIMAIEMANEPHTEDHYEAKLGQNPGEIVYQWLSEMSTYVRGLDANHLISSGEEGYKIGPSTEAEKSRHPWLSNGTKGVDFSRNLSLPNINFATVHPYPGNWGIPSTDIDWFITNFVLDRAYIAHGEGKPIVLEETGFSFYENTKLGYTDDIGKFMAKIYQAANQAGYAGTMAWELVPPGTEIGDYIFDFNSPIALSIFNQASFMAELNGT